MQQSELLFTGTGGVSVQNSSKTAYTDLFTASENAELIYKTANLAAKVGNYVGISMGLF